MAASSFFSFKPLFFLLLLSAVPIALLLSLERRAAPAAAGGQVYRYHSTGYFREVAKWDESNRRFLVSFMEGGVGEIRVSDDGDSVLEEVPVLKDADLAGNASLGISVDRPRNRLLVVASDLIGNRYSAVAAYDLNTWNRLFLTQLSGPGDEKAFADDVVADDKGNAYVTDAKGSKIWKVGPDGQLLSTITDPLFKPKGWHNNLIALNGIVHHQDGYLLVIHTSTGNLFKIEHLEGGKEVVKLVKLVGGGSLRFGDGIELLSATRLVVAAAHPSARLVESADGWETAAVVGRFVGPAHRVATAVAVKDGRALVSHLVGMGWPKKKHVLVEAKFG